MRTGDIATGEGWEVICGKWENSTPDDVDHLIADPPYDENTHDGDMHNSADGPVKIDLSFDPIEPSSIVSPFLNITRRWILCFCAVEQLYLYQKNSEDAWVRSGIWLKRDPTPQISGDRPATWGDGIAIMHRPLSMGRKGHMRWNGIDGKRGKAAVWIHKTCHRDRHHETQKPVPLMVDLVKAFTDPDDLVYDPFGGVMTTGVACMITGRRFIGHEMNEEYATIGAERLRAAEDGLELEAYQSGQGSIFSLIKEAESGS